MLPTTQRPVLSPTPMAMLGSPSAASSRLSAAIASSMPSAPRAPRNACSGSSSGAFQNAMMQSPIYLSMVPFSASTQFDSGVRMRLTRCRQALRIGLHALRDGGEAAHVAEQDGQLLHLAAELQQGRIVLQPLHHLRGQVVAEHGDDALPPRALFEIAEPCAAHRHQHQSRDRQDRRQPQSRASNAQKGESRIAASPAIVQKLERTSRSCVEHVPSPALQPAPAAP
jgi:hypothetical protein